MDDPQKANNSQFDLIRYPALIQVWYHHNQMQLQWPAVIVGTVLLFLAYIIVAKASKVLDVSAWGHDNELTFVVGIPMALTGIALLIVLHLMKRARLIMGIIEDQLIDMEKGQVQLTFKAINHPPGRSGAKFIWYFMLMCQALPMLTFGLVFSLGIVRSVISLLVVLVLVIGVKLTTKDSSKDSNAVDGLLQPLPQRNSRIWLVQTISLCRLLAALVFAWLAFKDVSRTLLSCFYGAAMLSDLIDGYVSRKLHAETYFGQVLDLVADKSLTVVSLLFAAACGVDLLPLALIATRDIIMIGMRSITARGKRLLPTSRIFGGSMALFIWGNTLLLLHARAAGQSITVINVIYWACALILAVNFVARVYVSTLSIREASTDNA